MSKALILAAGKGSRLNHLTKNTPKVLVYLLGLSLIERAILTARRAGIYEFVIVTGFQGDKIKSELGDGNRYQVKIDYVENKEWERGNGISVLKAKELLKGNFVLLMADHIFDAEILSEMKKMRLLNNECILCVDRSKKGYLDLEEATKVRVENDLIVDIGKDLKGYDALDCGIFLLSPVIFDALEESISKGKDALSDGIRVLAKRGKIKAFDIHDKFWVDIDTVDNYKEAEKILLKTLLKPTDGPVSRLLNRRISIRISKLLVKTQIKPISISFLSFIICILSAFFFTLGDYFYILIAGVLAQFSSIVDGCDGEVARLKFQESNYGAWFDAVLDRYADGLIIFGMVYGWWNLYGNGEIWIIGFIALIGSFMNSYTATKYDAILAKDKKRAKIRIGRDMRLFLIMIGAIFNQVFYTLMILGILTNAESIRRLCVLRNK